MTSVSTSDLLLLAVLLVGLVSVCSILGFALPQILREQEILDSLKGKFKEKFKGKFKDKLATGKGGGDEIDGYDAVIGFLRKAGKADGKTDFSRMEDVHRALLQLGDSDNDGNPGIYTAARLHAILCAVSKKNYTRKPPLLADLQELTLQQESAKTAVACFRALIPTILVLGILGTLFGVHQQLVTVGEVQLPELAKALGPGIFSVCLTVLCIILRSFYSTKFADFCTQLDTFTLQDLLPVFRTKSDVQLDAASFDSALKAAGALQLGDMEKGLAQFRRNVWRCLKACRENIALATGGTLEQLAVLAQRTALVFTRLKQRARVLKKHEEACAANAEACNAETLAAARQLDALARELAELAATGVSVAAMLQDGRPRLYEIWRKLYVHAATAREGLFQQAAADAALPEMPQTLLTWSNQTLPETQRKLAGVKPACAANLLAHAGRGQELHDYAEYVQGLSPQLAEEARQTAQLARRLREKTTDVSQTLGAAAGQEERRLQELHEKTEHTNLYPGGWRGVRMRVHDLVEKARFFFYHRWIGRLAGLALIYAFLLLLFYV